MRDCDGAIQLFKELQDLWSEAEIKACKWLGNSLEVLSAIPQERRALETNLTTTPYKWQTPLEFCGMHKNMFSLFCPNFSIGEHSN